MWCCVLYRSWLWWPHKDASMLQGSAFRCPLSQNANGLEAIARSATKTHTAPLCHHSPAFTSQPSCWQRLLGFGDQVLH